MLAFSISFPLLIGLYKGGQKKDKFRRFEFLKIGKCSGESIFLARRGLGNYGHRKIVVFWLKPLLKMY